MQSHRILFSLLLFYSLFSFSQNSESDLFSIKTLDEQIEEKSYTNGNHRIIDRFIIKAPISDNTKKLYSKKEWRRIKKQLQALQLKQEEDNSLRKDSLILVFPNSKNLSHTKF